MVTITQLDVNQASWLLWELQESARFPKMWVGHSIYNPNVQKVCRIQLVTVAGHYLNWFI